DLIVSNTGSADLGVTVSVPSGSTFSATPISFVVPGGSSQVVSVSFAPSSGGLTEETLSLLHNADGSPTTIAMSGVGTAPTIVTTPSDRILRMQ
ncbi:MAG: hypothetical protein IH991_15565, partial [Planctomycetes bacterium]|nr:hypothetical protein [Planctomycetota bacterium]